MTYTYTMTKADHLAYQLHHVSTKKSVKKQIAKKWIYITLCFALVSFMFYTSKDIDLAIVFAAITVLALLFYPTYFKRRYVNHYTKHVNETFKEKESTIVEITVNNEDLVTGNEKSESRIHLTAIENIAETGQHLFVYIGGGQGLIIPKTAADFDAIKSELRNASDKLNIPYQTDLNWRW